LKTKTKEDQIINLLNRVGRLIWETEKTGIDRWADLITASALLIASPMLRAPLKLYKKYIECSLCALAETALRYHEEYQEEAQHEKEKAIQRNK